MFKCKYGDEKTRARAGELKTAHGTVKTPFCMPVATKATTKFVNPIELKQAGANAIISNAMMLHCRPGSKFIREVGGLHKFMNYDGVIYTDSGGFQMQSKKLIIGIGKRGVRFRNPFNEQKMFLSPEDVMQVENDIGSDVAMVLDHMPNVKSDYEKIAEATERTHQWAVRCKKEHAIVKQNGFDKQLLFGIAQGGTYRDLREKSAKFINALDFDGVAMGGLCLGESKEAMFNAINYQVPLFDKDKIRYLMGVGSPLLLIEAVEYGCDCFDSIFPTQNARHNHLFTSKGMLNLAKLKHQKEVGPIDDDCDCYVCKNFTRAYLHHLIKVNEKITFHYFSYHNIHFIQNIMARMRESIKKGLFCEFKQEFIEKFSENPKSKSKQ